ncbi:hypothetical protein NQ318_005702 [Aromia moschata]|uniref:Uncharacterized protein n=1 Tax=Aromia moschata TaxID=1265417 RepID=A0AAV8XKW4_9CUCU|nr:hypothetical protein NQ318_005702 [Aromia moschata]
MDVKRPKTICVSDGLQLTLLHITDPRDDVHILFCDVARFFDTNLSKKCIYLAILAHQRLPQHVENQYKDIVGILEGKARNRG